MPDVPARLVTSWDDMKSPGDFMYHTSVGSGDAETGILFCCPCGCGTPGSVQFANTPWCDPTKPKWTFNGNREKPTLTPSIQRNIGCRWHGYLTDGVFRPC